MDIKAIKDSKFLKDMNKNELKTVASDIRSFILENVSVTGGHLSSNLGDVELIMALEEEFDIEIPDSDAEKVVTVGDVVDYIKDNA